MKIGLLAILLASAAVTAAEAQVLQVTIVPAQPLLERTLYGQAMNCDFRFANRGSQDLELRVVQLDVRDRAGALIARLELNDNGIQPGITIVPHRKRDGHDFYSHHRRFDLDHPVAVQIGFRTNAARYSYDYELATSAGIDGEGLPSQFVDFDRVLGSTRVRADGVSPDSGDIVEAR